MKHSKIHRLIWLLHQKRHLNGRVRGKELPENSMCEALNFGHSAIAEIATNIETFVASSTKAITPYQVKEDNHPSIDLAPLQHHSRRPV